nr:FecR domain-containing protein [Variovorax boronicumulans]
MSSRTMVDMHSAAVMDPAQGLVRQQAFEWQVTLWSGETTDDEQAAFAHWLAADPAHAIAWQQVQTVGNRLQGFPRDVAGGVLRTRAPSARRRRLLGTLGLVAGVGVLAYGLQRSPQWAAATAAYRTSTGERRDLMLPDGTQLVLNTASSVDVDFSSQFRLVELREGEIQVVTARGANAENRPFVVATTHGTVRPKGTRFTVRVLDSTSQVSVLDGSVQVTSRHAGIPAVEVAAGEKVRLTDQDVSAKAAVSANETAWVSGRLIAERMRLADFLGELGRYRRGVLRCDPAIAELAVSGVYPLADTDRVLVALERALPVRVHRITSHWVTVAAS